MIKLKRIAAAVLGTVVVGSFFIPRGGMAAQASTAPRALGAVTEVPAETPEATAWLGHELLQLFVWGSLPFLSVAGTQEMTSEDLANLLDKAAATS